MSLITRCPACGTMFKVVTDQLKVSQGWVRCGHCADVFVGSQYLQASNPPSLELASSDDVLVPAVDLPEVSLTAERDLLSDISGNDFNPAEWKRQRTAQLNKSVDINLNENGKAISAQMVAPSSILSLPDAPALKVGSKDSPKFSSLQEMPSGQQEAGDVSFVRDARRQVFWRKPFVRVALSGLCMALVALMLLQVVIQQKDRLAALEPRLRPSLQALCKLLQCEINPLRQIEAIEIDSSSFNKINANSFRLNFSLKNMREFVVAMPSLEVTLTDTQERPVVRRVFEPNQFGAPSLALGASSIFSGFVVIQVLGSDVVEPGSAISDNPVATVSGPIRVAGYRILAFYP